MMLDKFSLEISHHQLEVLNISDAEFGHMLLEDSLLMINLVFLLNDLLSDGKLFGNVALKHHTDANGQLQIINGKRSVFKPFINEVVQNINIKQSQIVEDFGLLFALDQQLKGIICKIVIAR
jgi:hypothetical protein